MKMGNYSLENWLDKLKDTAYMVVFHLPPGYILRGVPGWSYEIENTADANNKNKIRATVYYCYNSRLTGVGKKTKFNGTVDFSDISGALDDAPNDGGFGMFKELHSVCLKTQGQDERCKIFVKYGFVDPEPFLEQYRDGVIEPYISDEKFKEMKMKDSVIGISVKANKVSENTVSIKEEGEKLKRRIAKDLSDLPKPSKDYNLENDEDTDDWMRDLQEFVFKFLNKFLPEDTSKKLVTAENMAYWFDVFTHKSVDLENNYETYETIGDKAYALNMVEFLYNYGNNKNVDISSDSITNFIKEYGSKNFLSSIGIGEAVYPWLRILKVAKESKDKKSVNVKEDLVESIFGALYIIGNKTKIGAGCFLANHYFNFIFKGFTLSNEILQKKDLKTNFNQIFEQIGLKDHTPLPEDISTNKYKNEYKYKLEFTDKAYNQLKEDFPTLQRFIAEANGTSPKDTINKIYEKALQVLASYGITKEWVESNKTNRYTDELQEIDENLFIKVRNKLSRDGYWEDKNFTLIRVSGLAELGKTKIWQLRSDNKILATGQADNDRDARIEAFKTYIRKLV
jgi:dsRNA-specific ribonuclease